MMNLLPMCVHVATSASGRYNLIQGAYDGILNYTIIYNMHAACSGSPHDDIRKHLPRNVNIHSATPSPDFYGMATDTYLYVYKTPSLINYIAVHSKTSSEYAAEVEQR